MPSMFQVAAYVAVLTGAHDPFSCRAEGRRVSCDNGYAAIARRDGGLDFDNGVTASVAAGEPAFSNGITGHQGSGSWVFFSNGISARFIGSEVVFNTGMRCVPDTTDGPNPTEIGCAIIDDPTG